MIDNKFLPYAFQNISSEDVESIQHALTQPTITRGPLVADFEKTIADYCGATYAVAFNSGSTAMLAAYYAADVGVGDRILTTPNTFISTVGSGVTKGANHVFIDIDRATGNFNLEQLFANINAPSTRGKTIIVPVHFAGIPVDMQAIDAAISDPRTIIIEDAAHALGSKYKDGKPVGCCAWSHMTMFSFHPAKTITTGEGGMITTNDADLYHRLQLFRNNGIERDPAFLQTEAAPGYYEVHALSSNYNFTEMQAALGLSQFKRIERFIEKRQRLLALYHQLLAEQKHIRLLTPDSDLFVAPHLCVAQINFDAYRTTRSAVMQSLMQQGVGTQIHYIPLYRHPIFSKRSGELDDFFPKTEAYYAQALTLPLYYDLTEEDVHYVVDTLHKVLENRR